MKSRTVAYDDTIAARELKVRVGRRTMAVNNLSLSFGVGVHGLLGPNGAGKTTLIRTLATELRPTSGELSLLGSAVGNGDLRPLRRRLGYLPQQFGYYKRFTVREFVEYMAWLKEVPSSAVPAAVRRAVDRVGLTDRAESKLRTLSGGMVRRVGIAQAIVNEPEILLLDEPTVGLDPGQRLRLRELLQELSRDSCVVVSTHLVEDVAAACRDVVLVAAGQVVFSGSPQELAERGRPEYPGDTAIERGYSAVLAGGATGGTW